MGAVALSSPSVLVGGRHLEAISLSKLKSDEKHVLHTLASKLDYRGSFTEERWMAVAELCRRTSLGRRTVFRVLRTLEDGGYIVRTTRPDDDSGCRFLPSVFRLTAKLFDEYSCLLGEQNRKPKLHAVVAEGVPGGHGGYACETRQPCPVDTEAPPLAPPLKEEDTHNECVEIKQAYQIVRQLHAADARKYAGAWKATAADVVAKFGLAKLAEYRDRVAAAGRLGDAPFAKLYVNLERMVGGGPVANNAVTDAIATVWRPRAW